MVEFGIWDFSYAGGTFEVAFLASETFYSREYLCKSKWTRSAPTTVQIDWVQFGNYTLEVAADGKTMSGSVTGQPGEWRKAVFKRALTEQEVQHCQTAVDSYVPHVHGPGCGH
mmetsp:Transcript_15101/g.38321  ORF Transcript_15101/g.38321 Transcript_15101/m.38321 type:complete len:113 (-) Transcript_15101:263-601(-)